MKSVLDSMARKSIMSYIRQTPNIHLERIAQMITPHVVFDYDKLEKMYVNGIARGLIASVKDDDGLRRFFAVNNKGKTIYVDIDNCQDIELLSAVNGKMEIKLKGISKSYSKVKKQHEILKGQISMQEYMSERKAAHV